MLNSTVNTNPFANNQIEDGSQLYTSYIVHLHVCVHTSQFSHTTQPPTPLKRAKECRFSPKRYSIQGRTFPLGQSYPNRKSSNPYYTKSLQTRVTPQKSDLVVPSLCFPKIPERF